ncbi:hypothetical protein DFJ77DRAFT_526812 [Powellomyces hirtus]|nr:hypothetical protein DFJ77DRAFT_526812 [Powellomyces hirtus]
MDTKQKRSLAAPPPIACPSSPSELAAKPPSHLPFTSNSQPSCPPISCLSQTCHQAAFPSPTYLELAAKLCYRPHKVGLHHTDASTQVKINQYLKILSGCWVANKAKLCRNLNTFYKTEDAQKNRARVVCGDNDAAYLRAWKTIAAELSKNAYDKIIQPQVSFRWETNAQGAKLGKVLARGEMKKFAGRLLGDIFLVPSKRNTDKDLFNLVDSEENSMKPIQGTLLQASSFGARHCLARPTEAWRSGSWPQDSSLEHVYLKTLRGISTNVSASGGKHTVIGMLRLAYSMFGPYIRSLLGFSD